MVESQRSETGNPWRRAAGAAAAVAVIAGLLSGCGASVHFSVGSSASATFFTESTLEKGVKTKYNTTPPLTNQAAKVHCAYGQSKDQAKCLVTLTTGATMVEDIAITKNGTVFDMSPADS